MAYVAPLGGQVPAHSNLGNISLNTDVRTPVSGGAPLNGNTPSRATSRGGGSSTDVNVARGQGTRSSSRNNATNPPHSAIDETEYWIVVNYGEGGNYNAIITLLGNEYNIVEYRAPSNDSREFFIKLDSKQSCRELAGKRYDQLRFSHSFQSMIRNVPQPPINNEVRGRLEALIAVPPPQQQQVQQVNNSRNYLKLNRRHRYFDGDNRANGIYVPNNFQFNRKNARFYCMTFSVLLLAVLLLQLRAFFELPILTKYQVVPSENMVSISFNEYVSSNYEVRHQSDAVVQSPLRVNYNITLLHMMCEHVNLHVSDTNNAIHDQVKVPIDRFGQSAKAKVKQNPYGKTHGIESVEIPLVSTTRSSTAITMSNYQKIFATNPYTIVLFCTRQSTYCHGPGSIDNTWENLAYDVHSNSNSPLYRAVLVAKVNCDESKELCKDVPLFPTVRLFKGSLHRLPDYTGDRTVTTLTRYLTDILSEESRISVSDTVAQEAFRASLVQSHTDHPGCMLTGYSYLTKLPAVIKFQFEPKYYDPNPKVFNTKHIINSLSFGQPLTRAQQQSVAGIPTDVFPLKYSIENQNIVQEKSCHQVTISSTSVQEKGVSTSLYHLNEQACSAAVGADSRTMQVHVAASTLSSNIVKKSKNIGERGIVAASLIAVLSLLYYTSNHILMDLDLIG